MLRPQIKSIFLKVFAAVAVVLSSSAKIEVPEIKEILLPLEPHAASKIYDCS